MSQSHYSVWPATSTFVTVVVLLIVFGALVVAEVLEGSGPLGPLSTKPQNGGQPTSQPSS